MVCGNSYLAINIDLSCAIGTIGDILLVKSKR